MLTGSNKVTKDWGSSENRIWLDQFAPRPSVTVPGGVTRHPAGGTLRWEQHISHKICVW
jgi:hypothetical protein